MKLSREDVLHLATLCRLGLSEEEIERLKEQLSHILENFEVMQQLDTSDVPPTAYPIPLENVFREDEVAPSLPQSDILANAPRQEEGYFKVKAILEQ
jgi:aspartyl-tRNA(Asn)/glutamyl-tRNA(Gln) amidotransferase subunit C